MTDTKPVTGGARPRPDYIAEPPIDQLPDDIIASKRTGTRTDPKFTAAMEAARTAPQGLWVPVATFKSEGGAKTLFKKIVAKKVKIPEGEWDIEFRRVNGPNGDVWSKLYARQIPPPK